MNHAVVDVLVVVADVWEGLFEVQTVLASLRNDTFGLVAKLQGDPLTILRFDHFYVAPSRQLRVLLVARAERKKRGILLNLVLLNEERDLNLDLERAVSHIDARGAHEGS